MSSLGDDKVGSGSDSSISSSRRGGGASGPGDGRAAQRGDYRVLN